MIEEIAMTARQEGRREHLSVPNFSVFKFVLVAAWLGMESSNRPAVDSHRQIVVD